MPLKSALLSALSLCVLAACSTTPATSISTADRDAADQAARRGHALAERNNLAAALPELNEALRLNPDHARASFDRAMVRFAQGNKTGALSDIEHAVKLTPTDPRLLGAQCLIRVGNGQVDSGLGACEQGMKISAQAETQPLRNLHESNVRVARGQAYLLLKRHRDALTDFETALARMPTHARALYGRGIARQQLKDNAGKADVDEALRRLPGAGREFTSDMHS